jgi:hypothetical protein
MLELDSVSLGIASTIALNSPRTRLGSGTFAKPLSRPISSSSSATAASITLAVVLGVVRNAAYRVNSLEADGHSLSSLSSQEFGQAHEQAIVTTAAAAQNLK